MITEVLERESDLGIMMGMIVVEMGRNEVIDNHLNKGINKLKKGTINSLYWLVLSILLCSTFVQSVDCM